MIKRIVTALYEKPKPKFNLKDQKMNSNFTTLAPKVFEGENLADNNIYLDSLKEAIQIKENKNIALMGGYGSGKSSILKTFEKGNPKHNYLFLSLASFLDKENAEKDCGEQKAVVDNEKPRKWETIEKILVKQMIYKKAIKDLPYSRFKRISAVPTWSLWLNALGLVTLISLITFYEFILKMLTEPDKLSIIMFISILLLSTYFVGWILSYGSKVLKLSKFSFKSFTIEPSYDDTSYFSKYLDEIIYFFEVSKTDIVVIEDIDRFNSITIFEHLRELNYLLNNSEQINQDIRFIYAIRDDLFTSEGEPNLKESEEYLRTKFFDFIIPVIPVVDYSNSRNFLVPKVMSIIKGYSENNDNEMMGHENSTGNNVSINNEIEKFLWDISLYIDDLRIIYNICNEFDVYLKRQSHIKTTDEIEKLFALIVYKNIYPEDFSALQHNHGKLFEVFNSTKERLLKEKREEIMQQIKKNKDIVEGSNYEVTLSAKTAILHFVLRYIGHNFSGNIQYSVDKDDHNSFKSLNPLTNEKVNEFLQVKEYVHIRNGYNSTKKEITKSEIVKKFHELGVHTSNVIKKLEENEKEEINELIQQLEKEVNFIDAMTIKELFEDEYENSSIVTEEFKGYKLLMKYLLGSGYIDEQYNYYISNIYLNVLSANDVSVIQKIKSNTPLNKTDKITNYDLALYELSENDYKKPAILNNNIILYIFGKDNLTREQNSMISIFAHKTEKIKQIKLLEELFKEDNDDIKKFVTMLLVETPEIFTEIYNDENSTNAFNTTFIYKIFALCDIGIIENVYNKNSVFESSVLLIPNFVVNLYRDHEVDQETLNNFFEANMVRFKETGLSEMNSSNFNFFVRNNLYQINERNVLDIYEKVTEMSVEAFSVSELLKYDIQGLSQDINNYFDKYIELLVNKEDLYESSEVLLRILNESEVASEIKVEIIRKNNFKIHGVTEINDEELKREVFKNEKYDITLENIMNVPGKDINLVLNHFNDSDKIQEFTLEATEVIELDENFEKILYEFMSKLVNDAGIIVHEKNIEFFKMYREYEVDGMEDRTFKMLLNVRSIQSTISNINKLTGQNKIDLMILDEKFASDNFVELSMGEEELILGIQQFKEPLLSQIINSSFQRDELIVTDSVRWLKEVLKRKFELSASKTSNLFSNEDILDSDVFVEYLVYFIPQEILSESELLAKIPTIDESLENIRIGLHGKKTANIRYYELLRVLSDKGIIGKVKIEKNKVLFWNKHS